MDPSRRRLLAAATAGLASAYWPTREVRAALQPADPFTASWESLCNYIAPQWYRDAKFGIWAHWSAQCVPEQGDWYARNMYLQGDPHYEHHLQTYGHPTQTGFMEIDHLWKAERWEPDELMRLYKAAGARYFVALANHHDNFDTFDSKHHAWNAVNVGPRKDLVGGWAKAARNQGLRFGVSNHSAHAWHWLAAWMTLNSEALFATRPWRIYGEGPTRVQGGSFQEGGAGDFTVADFRFTQKANALYAIVLDRPSSASITVKSLADTAPGTVERVELVATGARLTFTRDAAGLTIALPANLPGEHAFAFKILGHGILV